MSDKDKDKPEKPKPEKPKKSENEYLISETQPEDEVPSDIPNLLLNNPVKVLKTELKY